MWMLELLMRATKVEGVACVTAVRNWLDAAFWVV